VRVARHRGEELGDGGLDVGLLTEFGRVVSDANEQAVNNQ
jgi:hypothetical protein